MSTLSTVKSDFIQKKIEQLIATSQANMRQQEGRDLDSYELERVRKFWTDKLAPSKNS